MINTSYQIGTANYCTTVLLFAQINDKNKRLFFFYLSQFKNPNTDFLIFSSAIEHSEPGNNIYDAINFFKLN